MYIVIVCVNCNGSSQVEESVLGQVVECPLCHQPTVARTPTAVLPVAKPIEKAPIQQTPLSLDDATPIPPRKKPLSPIKLNPPPTIPTAPVKRSPVRTAVYATISLIVTLLIMAGIYAGFQYGNGQISDSAWKSFRPPEGKCTVLMPGEPEASDIPPVSQGELGGKRFTVHLWFERVDVEFGWMDYDAVRVAEQLSFDQFVLPLRDREIKRLNGKLVGESQVNYTIKDRDFVSRLATIDLEKGKAFLQVYFDADLKRIPHQDRIELIKKQPLIYVPFGPALSGCWVPIEFTVQQTRRVPEPGARIRLWFACTHGRKITSDMKWISKFLTSFAPD